MKKVMLIVLPLEICFFSCSKVIPTPTVSPVTFMGSENASSSNNSSGNGGQPNGTNPPGITSASQLPQGTVIYQTTYSGNDGYWFTGTADSASATLSNSKYETINNYKTTFVTNASNKTFFGGLNDGVAIQAEVTVGAIDNNPRSFGSISWGMDSAGNHPYNFGIRIDGYFNIWSYSSENVTTSYSGLVKSNLIKIDSPNVLQVDAYNDTLYFLINGSLVEQMASPKGMTMDYAGYEADAQSTITSMNFKAIKL